MESHIHLFVRMYMPFIGLLDQMTHCSLEYANSSSPSVVMNLVDIWNNVIVTGKNKLSL